ncbi:MAG: hypothetical protein WAP51_00050 [Candidatus Sungiibacteriota bacterium]
MFLLREYFILIKKMSPIFDHTISPLTKAKRRIIFYLVVLLFLVITPLVALYSTGYKFDLKTRQLLPTGGIFIKTNQAGFKVFINGELAKQASFFSNGALVIDLKPDLYLVRIEKEGFKSWQRFVHVSGESVSESRFIMLFPEKIPEKEILDLSRRGLTIDEFSILEKSPWVAIRVNERKQLIYLFDRDTGALDAVESFADSRWDYSGRRLLVERRNPTRWAVVNLSSDKIREEKIAPPKKMGTITGMDFVAGSPNEFLALNSEGELLRFNKVSGEFSSVLSDINVFVVNDARLWFIGKNGFLASADLDGKNPENYGRKGFYISDEPVQVEASSGGGVFFIDSGGGFFVQEADDPEIVPIAGNVRSAALDAEGEKIVFCTDHDVNVMWLKDEQRQPFRKAGGREKIITLSGEELVACDWWGPDEENIVFYAGKFIGVVDIDTRASGAAATILYDDIKGSAGFEKEAGRILRSEKSFLFSAKLY